MQSILRRPLGQARASLLLILLALGVAACGGGDATSSSSAAAETNPSTVSAATAGAQFASGEATMIDVREPSELAEQHVPGAIAIPLGEVEARMAEIPQDKPVLVLCRSGNRARPAAQVLADAGYQARIVDGGIIAWDQAGLPFTGSAPG
jgi:rhodanese-related sulfurtransferase